MTLTTSQLDRACGVLLGTATEHSANCSQCYLDSRAGSTPHNRTPPNPRRQGAVMQIDLVRRTLPDSLGPQWFQRLPLKPLRGLPRPARFPWVRFPRSTRSPGSGVRFPRSTRSPPVFVVGAIVPVVVVAGFTVVPVVVVAAAPFPVVAPARIPPLAGAPVIIRERRGLGLGDGSRPQTRES